MLWLMRPGSGVEAARWTTQPTMRSVGIARESAAAGVEALEAQLAVAEAEPVEEPPGHAVHRGDDRGVARRAAGRCRAPPRAGSGPSPRRSRSPAGRASPDRCRRAPVNAVSSPAARTRRPSARIAVRLAPRATTETSWPARASHAGHQTADRAGAVDADFHGVILAFKQETAMFAFMKKMTELLPADEHAARARRGKLPVPEQHFVNGHRIVPPFPEGMQQALFGMGCFWGAERLFWQTAGRLQHRGRLRRRRDAEPDLRGSLQRLHQPRRGRARRVRPARSCATRRCSRCSGKATTRRRACARATTPARSTARRSTPTATSS